MLHTRVRRRFIFRDFAENRWLESGLRFYKRHPYGVACALGALLTLTTPPFTLFPLFFVILPLFMRLIATAGNLKAAILTGWAFGAGYFVVGVYWMSVAFWALYGDLPWLLPIAVFGIPLYIACTYAVAAGLAFMFRARPWVFALAVAIFFFWADYLRGHAPSNFPWNLPGSIWYHLLPVLQSLSVIGIYGLTFLTFLWGTLPYILLHDQSRAGRRLAAALVFSFTMILAAGALQLAFSPTVFNTGVSIQILQPNITQARKVADAYSHRDSVFAQHLELMRASPPPPAPVTLVVWPESVFAATESEAKARFAQAAVLLPHDGYVAIGYHRVVPAGDEKQVYNSLAVIDQRGAVQAAYDKSTLVPWGEYVPFRTLRDGALKEYFAGMPQLAAGSGIKTLHAGKVPPFSPAICFESIFSDAVADRRDRPHFLLIMSDNEWAAHTTGPWQHYSFTRLRAIEEGMPAILAANTGLSAIFDAQGRLLQRLEMGKAGVLKGLLPAMRPRPTPFSVMGDIPLLIFVSLLTGYLFILRYKGDKL